MVCNMYNVNLFKKLFTKPLFTHIDGKQVVVNKMFIGS